MPDAPAVDGVSKPCPKCGYIRTPLDTNPDWQCPRCRIAYAKYAAQAAQVRQSLAMHGREMTERAKSDHSLLFLVAVNAVALGVAYYLHMSLRGLMLVYWIQSVVIGVMNVIRILRLQRFATAGFTINDKPVTETPSSKRTVATFFALHYGLFHAVYLLYIVADSKGTFATPAGYLLCAAAFAINHAFSLRHNMESDAAGRPNIGTLMFLPYARVVPMHLMMVTGLAFTHDAGPLAVVVFGALKTAADALMHTVEHHMRAQAAPDIEAE